MKFAEQEHGLKDGRTLVLREAGPEDAEAVLAYLNRVGGESDNLLFGEGGFPVPLQREREFLQSYQEQGKSLMLLGFVEGELASLSSLDALAGRERTAHRASLSTTVARAYWGLGIGRQAMEALIAFARAAGLEVLQLEVRADNRRAVGLYQSLGFEKLGLYRNFMKVGGAAFDAWYMNLYL